MKYYILVGEASGDLHGSNLMKHLFKLDPNATIRFWGGDLMLKQGGTLVKHYKERAFMGFGEVVMNLPKILNFISFCKKDIEQFKPDVVIFIDNSGFNLRIAKWAKAKGFNTNYYISPQVWASRSGRVKDIKRDIDQMLVILPFEKEFYKKFDYDVEFVGHPLLDAIEHSKFQTESEFRAEWNLHPTKKLIALLPGSRKQEIKRVLPIMLSAVSDYTNYEFVVAGAPSQTKEFYEEFLSNNVKLVENQTYNLLNNSLAALVTSGTATLETALFNVPQVVCYTGSRISYEIAKRLIKNIRFIALVNLIMDKEVVKELIQNELTVKTLKLQFEKLLEEGHRNQVFSDYTELKQKLGGLGASERAAQLIIHNLNK